MRMKEAEFIHIYNTDKKIQRAFLKHVIKEKAFVTALAREVFNIDAKAVGINAPGTISEFIMEKLNASEQENP